jgi:integrase
MECCRLRVKDVDFSRNEIVIQAGKVIKTVARCRRQRSRNLPTNISERIDPNIKKI